MSNDDCGPREKEGATRQLLHLLYLPFAQSTCLDCLVNDQ